MLTLVRYAGDYHGSALILMQDGRVVGEIIVLQTGGHGYSDQRVRIGLRLPSEVRVVRADAQHRPEGPTDEWIAAQANYHATYTPSQPTAPQANAYPGGYSPLPAADEASADEGGVFYPDEYADDEAGMGGANEYPDEYASDDDILQPGAAVTVSACLAALDAMDNEWPPCAMPMTEDGERIR